MVTLLVPAMLASKHIHIIDIRIPKRFILLCAKFVTRPTSKFVLNCLFHSNLYDRFLVYDIWAWFVTKSISKECGLATFLSIKKERMRPSSPSSIFNHCEEVLWFLNKAANLRLFCFGKEQGTSLFTTSRHYTLCGYDSMLRLVTARDQVLHLSIHCWAIYYSTSS